MTLDPNNYNPAYRLGAIVPVANMERVSTGPAGPTGTVTGPTGPTGVTGPSGPSA